MIELEERELLEVIWRKGEALAVYLHTPLCGTCRAARRMIEVAEHLLPPGTFVSGNVNVLPTVVKQYKIASVPALMVFEPDRKTPPVIHYAMRSVDSVLEYVREGARL
ncbi:thioredoxin family protein [Paenibacillus sp. CN-4]|uniref:thioredoxin family protein n=1 Tax=Paenibacillus nanchangensis TaxID=3348343 RepID=UPI00397CF58C